MSDTVKSRAIALRKAKEIGCEGAHQHEDGWMPCSDHAEWVRLTSNPTQESKTGLVAIQNRRNRRTKKGKRRKKRNSNWENLGQRGVMSIDTMPGGGLTSGAISTKSAWAPIDGDVDVFTDIASARRRARQLGCIGVARRSSRSGQTVWTPCSNMTDYQKRTGSTAFGRQRREARELMILRNNLRKLRGGKTLMESLYEGKSLGRKIRGATARFDANAIDGDEDGIVQDGTPFERPAMPSGFASSMRGVERAARRRDRREERGERRGTLRSEPDTTAREVELMTWRERRDFEKLNQAPQPTDAELEEQFQEEVGFAPQQEPPTWDEMEGAAQKFYMENPQFLIDEPGLADTAPDNVRRGFASSIQSGNRAAVGSGGKAMSDMIINRVSEEHTGKPAGGRTLHFVGGTAGSGKSTLVKNGTLSVPPSNAAAHIDPDEIKTGLVGYNSGRGAQAVHPASRKVTDKTMERARDEGMDMVVQGIGKRTEHLEWARRHGYRTVGHFVHIDPFVADERIAQREAQGGTRLPPGYGTHMLGYIQNEVPRQITRGLYDEFVLWNNNRQPPTIIAQANADGTFSINDDIAFDAFFGFTGGRFVRQYWQQRASQKAPDSDSGDSGLG